MKSNNTTFFFFWHDSQRFFFSIHIFFTFPFRAGKLNLIAVIYTITRTPAAATAQNDYDIVKYTFIPVHIRVVDGRIYVSPPVAYYYTAKTRVSHHRISPAAALPCVRCLFGILVYARILL